MIERIDLQAIRSWSRGGVSLSGGVHVFWGANGAGKTTLLEASIVAATGRSHRAGSLRELVAEGADSGALTVTVGDGASSDDPLARTNLTVELSRTERTRHLVAGTARRSASLRDRLKVATFVPEETGLVAAAPSLRRGAFDRIAAQWHPGYDDALDRYERALKQRNRLLKDALDADGAARRALAAELKPWTALLVESGTDVVLGRLALLRALAAPIEAAHREVAPDEGRLSIAYRSREGHAEDASPDAVATALRDGFDATAEAEGYQGATLIGPHRDDFGFFVDARDLAPTASRGQQRSLLLALLFAEIELLADRSGRPPVLLLDDAFSELDPDRRDRLVGRLVALPQAIVTTTTLEDLAPTLVARATTHEVVRTAKGSAVRE